MCVVSDWPKGKRADDMSVNDLKRLIDAQYGAIEVKLQGIGEPLMAGDSIFEMIRYIRAKHIWVRTTTNASLLHLRSNHRKLIDADPNEIQISIDGATSETFESIRRGGNFARVVNNCKLINDYSRERGVVRTKMWTVVQRKNVHELSALVDLAQEAGFSNMVFSLELIDWGNPAWRQVNDAESVESVLDPDRLFDLVEYGDALGVKVRFWNATEKHSTDKPENLCPWPFERAVVTSDMRVVPCCMIGDPDSFEIGRDTHSSLLELWRREEYRAFHQAHLTGDLPSVCRGCYHDTTHRPDDA